MTFVVHYDDLGVSFARHGGPRPTRWIRNDIRYLQEAFWLALHTDPDLVFNYGWNELYEGEHLLPDSLWGRWRYDVAAAMVRAIKTRAKADLPRALVIVDSLLAMAYREHRRDPRILCWDLYNEPSNAGMGNASLSLLMDVFRWAREINPVQPITSGIWGGSPRVTRFLRAESDIISFHNYRPAPELRREIQDLKQLGRPLICSEWLNRPHNSTVETCLPVFVEPVKAILRSITRILRWSRCSMT